MRCCNCSQAAVADEDIAANDHRQREHLQASIHPDGEVATGLESLWPTFAEYEAEKGIPIEQLLPLLSRLHEKTNVQKDLEQGLMEFEKFDKDKNGRINYEEFTDLVTQTKKLTPIRRTMVLAIRSIVPGNLGYLEAGYLEQFNCCPPPIFMVIISIIELTIFIGYAVHRQYRYDPDRPSDWGVPVESPLIYNPARRYEVWRYVTYMFIHSGVKHVAFNLLFQLFIGLPLEMVHKIHRVALIYVLGVIAGSLGSSVVDPWTILCGASGGCYALVGAQFANIFMNWEQMTKNCTKGKTFCRLLSNMLVSGPVQLTIWSILAIIDTGLAIYDRFYATIDVRTSFTAHFAGALAGVMLGILFGKNIEWLRWEIKVWWVVLGLSIVLVIFGILFNAFHASHYPPTDWRPCCPLPNYTD